LNAVVLKSSNAVQVKKFNFNYSYFEANNNRKYPATGSNDPRNFLNYRLRLDAVQEVSSDGTLQSPHRFEYYGDNDPETYDPYTLPYRLSPSQDHWGFYNNSNNQNMFPSNPINKPFRIDEWFQRNSGGFDGLTVNFGYRVETGTTREPDPEALKAGLLHEIIYPTGGYTRFEFEGHNLASAQDPFYPLTGGVRIKQVESKATSTTPAVVKNYEYLDQSIVDYNKCLSMDNPYYTWYFNRELHNADLMAAFGVPSDMASTYSHVGMVEASPQLMLGSGMHPVYSKIRESSPGNGSTLYEYNVNDEDNQEYSNNGGVQLPDLFYSASIYHSSYAGDYHLTEYTLPCTFPFPNFLNNDWRRGHLKTKRIYSDDNLLLSQDSIIYDVRSLKAVPGYKVVKLGPEAYLYSRYYNIAGYVKPIKEITRTYNSNGSSVRTVKDLEYTSVYHKQLTESKEYTSKGDIIVQKYYYPPEYGNTMSALNNSHILIPVDVRSYKNGNLIMGEQIQYGSNGLPLTIYRAETNGLDVPFNSQSPFTFSLKFSNLYNVDNTLLSQSVRYGTPTIFLWSYKGKHPIAQIINASYEDVKTALNDPYEDFISEVRNKLEPTEADLNRLNSLRNSFVLKNASVTTYTYKPLVGMTSQKDAKGQTTYYQYDNFQRLSAIKDQNGYVIKSFDYHYKTN